MRQSGEECCAPNIYVENFRSCHSFRKIPRILEYKSARYLRSYALRELRVTELDYFTYLTRIF